MVNIPLLSTIDLPINVLNLFSIFVDVAKFNIFSSDKITDTIFRRESFSDEILDPLNERFELNSYTTSNLIYNMGTSFYFMVILVAATLFLWILTKVTNYCITNRLV
jgi:hypothetical protein